MLRVLILDIPEVRAWQESEFLEQIFGFWSGHFSRKARFFHSSRTNFDFLWSI